MFHVGEEVIGGASAGVVGTLLGFPLDLAKTRMQTSSSEATRGALSLLLHIFRSEGVRNLYKGVGPPLLSLSVVNTVSFTSYSFFNKTLFFGQEGWDWRNALAGMCGSPVFGLITTPENLLKTQMQLDNVQAERHRGRFANSFHCAQSLVKTHGATILYTGHMINTVREACFVGTYFFCYEGMKQEFQRRLVKMERRLLPSSKEEIWSSTFAVPMAGGIAGATAWFITFPLDCIRAGVQGQLIPLGSGAILQTHGAVETTRKLLREKGLLGLYSGVGPSIARAFLVSSSRFSAYEGAVYLCRYSGLTSSRSRTYSEEEEGPAAFDD